MALNATHFRIAHDLARDLKVSDHASYYEGTICPDTRYITGIARGQTHGDGCPQDPFAVGLSDFEKGWAVHLMYDRLSKYEQVKLIPIEFGAVAGFNDAWVYLTAIKYVEDIESCRQLGEQIDALRHLHSTQTPREENPEVLETYLRGVGEQIRENAELSQQIAYIYPKVLQRMRDKK